MASEQQLLEQKKKKKKSRCDRQASNSSSAGYGVVRSRMTSPIKLAIVRLRLWGRMNNAGVKFPQG